MFKVRGRGSHARGKGEGGPMLEVGGGPMLEVRGRGSHARGKGGSHARGKGEGVPC